MIGILIAVPWKILAAPIINVIETFFRSIVSRKISIRRPIAYLWTILRSLLLMILNEIPRIVPKGTIIWKDENAEGRSERAQYDHLKQASRLFNQSFLSKGQRLLANKSCHHTTNRSFVGLARPGI